MFNCRYHPFAVDAFFKHSLVITYAAPKAALQKLIPPFLTLDTHLDKYAFVAAAFVDTRQLRPTGFPPALGNDFVLAGFRVFVRCKTSAGKNLRGLYILKSLTNKKRMAWLGNFFTHYHYSSGQLGLTATDDQIMVQSADFGIDVKVAKLPDVHLPGGSPFTDWATARRFAGPLPFTFTATSDNKVLIVEGVREHWQPQPVKLIHAKIDFINHLQVEGLQPAAAFLVADIPYHWKKGKIDIWKP